MEKTEPRINVFPKINSGGMSGIGRKSNHPTFDPDVESILNPKKSKSDMDILGMPHEPTSEEQHTDSSKSTVESQWSWLIIILAVIVIVLIIFIAWYVLKENDDVNKPPNIPRDILHTNPQMNPTMYQNMSNQVHPSQNFSHPLHPNNRPQTENLPIQTKSMSSAPKPPTKQELMAALSKMTLDPVKEEETSPISIKTLKSSKKQEGKINMDQDNVLAGKFYQNLQQNINNDEKDDSDDEEDATD